MISLLGATLTDLNPPTYAASPAGAVLSRQPLGTGSVDTLKGVENLMRLREPAAWVALGALVLNLVLALVALATFDGPLASVAWVLSARLANPVPLVVLTVLVSFCVLRERTPHARQLTLISLVVGVVAVLLGLTFALLGFGATAPVLAVFAAVVQQAISVIAIGFLIKLVQLQAVPRRLPAGIGLAPYPSDALPPSPAPAAPDQHLQPTWHPDTAAGAAWRTAGDAAAGAPAAGWGGDPSVGWQPIPTQPSGPEPNGPQPPGPQPNGPQFNAYGPTERQPDRLEPQGRTPNDDRMRATLPAPEPAPSVLKDPWTDQAQRKSQQPGLDWPWGRSQS